MPRHLARVRRRQFATVGCVVDWLTGRRKNGTCAGHTHRYLAGCQLRALIAEERSYMVYILAMGHKCEYGVIHHPSIWIPRELTYRVISARGRCRLRWVSELLDSSGKEWDYNLLLSYFRPCRCWCHQKEGCHLLEHGKNMHFHCARCLWPGPTAQEPKQGSMIFNLKHQWGHRVVWNHVWRGAVSRKVKIFTWKPGRDALPTKSNKHNRKNGARCELQSVW
jgi:hypothetical protein